LSNRWVIVFAAAIVTTVGFGSRGVFSVFYVEMLREFSWDRADLAGVYSLGMLIMGVPLAWLWAFIVLFIAIIQVPVLLVSGPIIAYVFSYADPTMLPFLLYML